MNIQKTKEGGRLTLALEGSLDTNTAPQLAEELAGSLQDVDVLTLDFARLDYISSAGLRVLLMTQKKMDARGSMIVCHVSDTIAELFEVTGFADILTVE